jgi:hypothetical protein
MSLTQLAALAASCSNDMRADAAAAADSSLIAYQGQLAAIARQIELAAAAVAAEIAHRSRRELGYDGLAARLGARSPEALVQTITGASAPTARRLVSVGTLVAAPAHPWLQPAIDAVAAGALSAEALQAIEAGLGAPSDAVSASDLSLAASTLCTLGLPLERLAARARELRAELDATGVALREEQLRERRFLRLVLQPDGLTRLSGLLDPESAAIVGAAIDSATSPRRGGPRFVDPTEVATASALVDDPRTTEQIALDALVQLVDVAVRSAGLPARRADVRVLVTQADLDRRAGVGFIEGQTAPISLESVERQACDGGLIPVLFSDDGQALNLGRSQRLHSAKQRVAIAVRDGGCLAPDCERPPSWCEVHHIHEFGKGGATDLADGVLLCRHHHMLVHNNHWRVERREGRYWFVPPPDIDPRQVPIELATKSAAVRRMRRAG